MKGACAKMTKKKEKRNKETCIIFSCLCWFSGLSSSHWSDDGGWKAVDISNFFFFKFRVCVKESLLFVPFDFSFEGYGDASAQRCVLG